MFQYGSVAQLVEQRPEEPCVDGSSPPGATSKTINLPSWEFFVGNRGGLDFLTEAWYNGRIGVLTLSTCTEVKGMTNVISVGIWAVIFVLYYRAVKMVKDWGRKVLGVIMLIMCVMEIAMSVVWFFSKNQRLLVSPFILLLDGVLLLMAIRNYNLVKETSN